MKWTYLFCLILVACTQNVKNDAIEKDVVSPAKVDSLNVLESNDKALNDSLDEGFKLLGLVDVASVNANIKVDLKYASKDNFMHIVLYDTLRKCYLQKEVAERLSKCQNYLDSIRPGYSILIFDGLRPQQVQREMWNALDSIPRWRRGKFVSNPTLGSVHNYGAAVDVTIVDSKGKELDMGAEYDDFREIAFPKLEAQFLKSGELSKQQVDNRKLLRKVMSSQQFRNIPTEWWHFNAFSRITTSYKYQMLETESGKTKWFRIVPKKDTTVLDESEE